MIPAGEQATPTIDVVIPVYNAPGDLERCVASVLAHTRGGYRLILIDDASPDPRVREVFARLGARGLPQLTLLANETNLGFTGTANRGLRLSDNDVVLLNSDTEVTAGWLDALARCAASSPHVGTITPWSNNAEICSYPRFCADNPWPEGADPEPVRAALAAAAAPSYPLLPTGVGFCLYVKRALIDAIGVFDPAFGRGYGEENDFCLRAHRAGYWNVLCDDAFVLHLGGRSFAGEKARLSPRNTEILLARHPDYTAIVGDYVARDPLRPLREAALAQERTRDRRPGILHILHHHGGGTEHHVRALIDASRAEWRHCIALAVGDRWQVEEHLDDGTLRAFEFSRREDEGWIAFVGGIAATFGLGVIHVHQLSMCRDPLLATLPALGLPYGLTVHDLNFACPTTTMLGADGFWCGARGDVGACEACAGGENPWEWRERHRPLVARAAFVIAPSRWAADTFRAFFPVAVDVIAHGAPGVWARAASAADRTAPPPPSGPLSGVLLPADDVPTVAIVGAIGPDKGARRIEALTALARARGSWLRFVVIGYLDRQSGPWQSDDARLTVHGRYDPNALPRLLDHYRAALVAYPSHGPESFSFTLSEVWAAGRPAVVPPIGALAERVDDTGAGFVLTDAEWRDDAAFLDRLLALVDPRAADVLRAAGAAARAQPQPTLEAMAGRTVAHYRRALATAPTRTWPPLAPARVRDALGYQPWWMPEQPPLTPELLSLRKVGVASAGSSAPTAVVPSPASPSGAPPTVPSPPTQSSPPAPTQMPPSLSTSAPPALVRAPDAAPPDAADASPGARAARAALRWRHSMVGRVLYRLAPVTLIDALKARLR
jgi:GT2 family glycosyltransferase/glycosyltransferase involved in cell wall biosynthesis